MYPHIECAFVRGGGLILVELLESGRNACLDGPLTKDLGAEGVDGSDPRFFQPLQRIFEILNLGCGRCLQARRVKLQAQAKAELTGGLAHECYGNHAIHRRPARAQDSGDAAHQFGGLARPGGRLDDQRLVQRVSNAFTRDLVRRFHGMLRSCSRSRRRSVFLIRSRRSSLGPQTIL